MFKGVRGRRSDVKKAIVTLAPRVDDRRDDGESDAMAFETIPSDYAGHPSAGARRQVGPVQGQAAQEAGRRPVEVGWPHNTGRVTSWQKGGGHKQSYRLIDFKRRKFDVVGTVERIEYDPNRTAFIALITYEDGEQAYILAPQRLGVGDKVIAGEKVDVKPGNAMPLARDAGRHDRAQCRAASGQGRASWPVRPARTHSWSVATAATPS